MELDVLSIKTPVRMTPCPLRLHHQTLWMGGILQSLTEVVHTIELDVLSIKTPVRMTPCPHRLHHQTSWTGGILMGKITF